MASAFKTFGVTMLSSLAIPVAGLSGLGAAGAGLSWIFFKGNRTAGVAEFFLVSVIIFVLTFRFLVKLQKNAKELVQKINQENQLDLDASNLLGYPSPVFLSFDSKNRRVAICNSVDGSYRLNDLNYLIEWRVEWRIKTSMEATGLGKQINATGMRAPSFEQVERRADFCLVLTVSDPGNPIMKFPMSERACHEWYARLNVIYNG
ncbi:hypothetical protein [Undibacterium sp. Di24W]|uniref:hypothetical protein n=1 Tax=Undibacterium sp. Di24W TaxID=3413033 RepID=UPI003BF19BF8